MSIHPAQETDRIATRRVGVVGALTLVVVAGSIGLVVAFLGRRPVVGPTPAALPAGSFGIVEESPILDAHRASDLSRAQRVRLTQYHWLDEQHDSAEIPIDRAMAIVAEKKQ